MRTTFLAGAEGFRFTRFREFRRIGEVGTVRVPCKTGYRRIGRTRIVHDRGFESDIGHIRNHLPIAALILVWRRGRDYSPAAAGSPFGPACGRSDPPAADRSNPECS